MSTFRPDHNGECLNCDEWLDGHGEDLTCPTDEAQAVANVEAYHAREQLRRELRAVFAACRDEPDSITCPFCNARSYNANDIREKYCGRCKRFQEPEKP